MRGKTHALWFASQGGYLDIVSFLVGERGADVRATELHQETTLLHAAVNGHLDVLDYLLKLLHAAVNGHLDVVDYLLKHGALYGIDMRPDKFRSPALWKPVLKTIPLS